MTLVPASNSVTGTGSLAPMAWRNWQAPRARVSFAFHLVRASEQVRHGATDCLIITIQSVYALAPSGAAILGVDPGATSLRRYATKVSTD